MKAASRRWATCRACRAGVVPHIPAAVHRQARKPRPRTNPRISSTTASSGSCGLSVPASTRREPSETRSSCTAPTIRSVPRLHRRRDPQARIWSRGEEVQRRSALVWPSRSSTSASSRTTCCRRCATLRASSTQALHPFILNTDAVAECFGVVPSIASVGRIATSTGPSCSCSRSASRTRTSRASPHRLVDLEGQRGRLRRPRSQLQAHEPRRLPGDAADHPVRHDPGGAAPRGGEIEFENIRRLLYVLRDKLIMPIKWVSFDKFQSTDSMQILHSRASSSAISRWTRTRWPTT